MPGGRLSVHQHLITCSAFGTRVSFLRLLPLRGWVSLKPAVSISTSAPWCGPQRSQMWSPAKQWRESGGKVSNFFQLNSYFRTNWFGLFFPGRTFPGRAGWGAIWTISAAGPGADGRTTSPLSSDQDMQSSVLASLRSWAVFFLPLRLRNLKLAMPGLKPPSALLCRVPVNKPKQALPAPRGGRLFLLQGPRPGPLPSLWFCVTCSLGMPFPLPWQGHSSVTSPQGVRYHCSRS